MGPIQQPVGAGPVVVCLALHAGRFTCGFDTWIESCRFSQSHRRLVARLKPSENVSRNCCVFACMNPGGRYQATWNGVPMTFTRPHDALLQIQLPPTAGELVVTERADN